MRVHVCGDVKIVIGVLVLVARKFIVCVSCMVVYLITSVSSCVNNNGPIVMYRICTELASFTDCMHVNLCTAK